MTFLKSYIILPVEILPVEVWFKFPVIRWVQVHVIIGNCHNLLFNIFRLIPDAFNIKIPVLISALENIFVR